MATTKQTKLDRVAERIQPAMRLLGDLRRSLEAGQHLNRQLVLIEELGEELMQLEDAAGVVTPEMLFDA